MVATKAIKQEPPMTVVIAEDNATTRRCIKDHLEVLGYEVVGAATNGEAAVELTRELHPSLVILDVKMPRMNGLDAARAITAIEPVPIILVTGLSSDEIAAEAIEAGVFSYLVKPVTKKHLMPAIKLALARYKEFASLKEEVKDLHEAVDAYRLLQTQSQKENKKMRDIAEMVVSASKLI
jgi:response regulator NasT